MKKSINIFIVAADSIGLRVDTKVVASALATISSEMDIGVVLHEVNVPRRALNTSDNSVALEFPVEPHIIINLEQIYKLSDPRASNALHILIPNPEWISPVSGARIFQMSEIWHKTHYSKLVFQNAFPEKRHIYIGFTSIDPGYNAHHNRNFAHFKGKSVTRNSEKILSIWYRRRDLPELKLQFFTNALEADFFAFPEWLNWQNISVKMGNVSNEDYFEGLSSAGIHLCTSEVEGFGHYINESRAMGAVIITTDAPPMNELIDSQSGVLISPLSTTQMSLGFRHLISEESIEEAINQVLKISDEELMLIRKNARKRYLKDRQNFITQIQNTFSNLVVRHLTV